MSADNTLIVRVRTPQKMLRVTVPNTASTADLRAAVAKELGRSATGLELSLTDTYDAPVPASGTLKSLGFENGQLLYYRGPAASGGAGAASSPAAKANGGAGSAAAAAAPAAAPAAAAAAAPVQLTPRCQHGPRGRCHHCMGATKEDIEKLKGETLNKAVAFNSRAAAMTADPKTLTGELRWLCTHRPDQMCVNCAPLHKDDPVKLEMLCQHGPGARCTNCLPPDTTVDGRKYISYTEWLEQRRAKCEHSFSAVCVNCMPPSQVMYRLKPGCSRHKPWPAGLCSDCAPPAVDLSAQPYRHLDYITINNVEELANFQRPWVRNKDKNLQRAGYIYGRYVADDTNYRGGMRALLEAVYEPPQLCNPRTGAIRVLPDPNQARVDAVAAALGLQRIGWVFTKPPKQAGSPEVEPMELFAMALMQLQHPKPAEEGGAGSRFFSLVLRIDPTNFTTNQSGYMATDQMMAIVRDGVVMSPAQGDKVMKVREQKPGEPPVPEVITKSKVTGALRAKEFEVEIGLITVESGAGAGDHKLYPPVLKHTYFATENREDLEPARPDAHLVKVYLEHFGHEPLHTALADFHLLCFLARSIGEDNAVAIAQAVGKGEAVPEGAELILRSWCGLD